MWNGKRGRQLMTEEPISAFNTSRFTVKKRKKIIIRCSYLKSRRCRPRYYHLYRVYSCYHVSYLFPLSSLLSLFPFSNLFLSSLLLRILPLFWQNIRMRHQLAFDAHQSHGNTVSHNFIIQ